MSLQNYTGILSNEAKAREWIRCQQSPEYLLENYGWIKDPATERVLRFNLWPHQRMLLRNFLDYLLLIILKSKQIGASWTVSGYGLWTAEFREASAVLMMSKGENEAWELLAKAKFIWEHLPDFLQLSLGSDQSSMLTFPAMDSKIKSLPSTKGAGVGETATVVIQDEWDFHPYGEENYGNLKATASDGAQFIGLSTTDKTKAVTHFKKMYRQAILGENNFHPVFLPYNVRPDRDEAWLERQKKDFPAYLVEQNYPVTEEEALSAPQALAFFEIEALKGMLENCIKPVEERGNGLVKIYKKPVVGRRYAAGVDLGEGNGGNYSVAVILDRQTLEIVAVLRSNTLHQDLFAFAFSKLYEMYYKPFYVPESNVGGLFIKKCLELNCDNLWYDDMDKRQKPGFRTTRTNKPVVWGFLEEAVRNREIIIWDRDVVSEMFSFIREGDKIQAQEGAYDDCVDALALALKAAREVGPRGSSKAVAPMRQPAGAFL